MKKFFILPETIFPPSRSGSINSPGIAGGGQSFSVPGRGAVVIPVVDVVDPPAQPFTPADLIDNGLLVWLKSDTEVTGASEITGWADQSGNDYDLETITGQEPELVDDVLNGYPAVSTYSLTGNRRLKTTDLKGFTSLAGGGAVFFVGRQNSAGSVDNFGCWLGCGAFLNVQIERGAEASDGFGSIAGAIASNNEVTTTATVPEDTFVSVRLVNDVDTNKICFNNGTPVSLASTDETYQNSPLQLFRSPSGAQGTKQFTEIVIMNQTPTTEEISNIESYFKTKYAHY